MFAMAILKHLHNMNKPKHQMTMKKHRPSAHLVLQDDS